MAGDSGLTHNLLQAGKPDAGVRKLSLPGPQYIQDGPILYMPDRNRGALFLRLPDGHCEGTINCLLVPIVVDEDISLEKRNTELQSN